MSLVRPIQPTAERVRCEIGMVYDAAMAKKTTARRFHSMYSISSVVSRMARRCMIKMILVGLTDSPSKRRIAKDDGGKSGGVSAIG